MNYKMVVLDLDGTLLNDEKIISKKNIYMLHELYNKGIEIVIATGRNYYMAKQLIADINVFSPVILANNGAIIRRSHNDELLESNYLDPLSFEVIYNEGLKYGLNPVIHVDEYRNGYDLIYEQENYEEVYGGYIKKGYERARQRKFEQMNMKNILSVCYFEEYDRLCQFGYEMEDRNNGRFHTICNRNVSSRALLEFLHKDGCKWIALKKYMGTINISPKEIIAIGDDNNDLELIFNAGIGIAMKNGTDECRSKAKYISEYDNNNSGVYYELSKIFKIK